MANHKLTRINSFVNPHKKEMVVHVYKHDTNGTFHIPRIGNRTSKKHASVSNLEMHSGFVSTKSKATAEKIVGKMHRFWGGDKKRTAKVNIGEELIGAKDKPAYISVSKHNDKSKHAKAENIISIWGGSSPKNSDKGVIYKIPQKYQHVITRNLHHEKIMHDMVEGFINELSNETMLSYKVKAKRSFQKHDRKAYERENDADAAAEKGALGPAMKHGKNFAKHDRAATNRWRGIRRVNNKMKATREDMQLDELSNEKKIKYVSAAEKDAGDRQRIGTRFSTLAKNSKVPTIKKHLSDTSRKELDKSAKRGNNALKVRLKLGESEQIQEGRLVFKHPTTGKTKSFPNTQFGKDQGAAWKNTKPPAKKVKEKEPKINLSTLYNNIVMELGSWFPDGDPTDAVSDMMRKKKGTANAFTWDDVTAALKKHKMGSLYDIYDEFEKSVASSTYKGMRNYNESVKTSNQQAGYYGTAHVNNGHKTDAESHAHYGKMHKHVKALTGGDTKSVKHYLDSVRGRHLVGKEDQHDYIKADYKKFMKRYNPKHFNESELNEATFSANISHDDYQQIRKASMRGNFTHKFERKTNGDTKFKTTHPKKLAADLEKLIDSGETSWSEILGVDAADMKSKGKTRKTFMHMESNDPDEPSHYVVYRDSNGRMKSTLSFTNPNGANRYAAKGNKRDKVGGIYKVHKHTAKTLRGHFDESVDLNERVRSADKKPEIYAKANGKKGVRMVPSNDKVIDVRNESTDLQELSKGTLSAYKKAANKNLRDLTFHSNKQQFKMMNVAHKHIKNPGGKYDLDAKYNTFNNRERDRYLKHLNTVVDTEKSIDKRTKGLRMVGRKLKEGKVPEYKKDANGRPIWDKETSAAIMKHTANKLSAKTKKDRLDRKALWTPVKEGYAEWQAADKVDRAQKRLAAALKNGSKSGAARAKAALDICNKNYDAIANDQYKRTNYNKKRVSESKDSAAWPTRKGKWANAVKGGFNSRAEAEAHYAKHVLMAKNTKVPRDMLRPRNEETELNELSKKTMMDYVHKAGRHADAAERNPSKKKTLLKREKGIAAVKRALYGEDTQLESTNKYVSFNHKEFGTLVGKVTKENSKHYHVQLHGFPSSAPRIRVPKSKGTVLGEATADPRLAAKLAARKAQRAKNVVRAKKANERKVAAAAKPKQVRAPKKVKSDIRDASERNIIMQLRKAQDVDGKHEIEFRRGKGTLDKAHIDTLLRVHDGLSKPAHKRLLRIKVFQNPEQAKQIAVKLGSKLSGKTVPKAKSMYDESVQIDEISKTLRNRYFGKALKDMKSREKSVAKEHDRLRSKDGSITQKNFEILHKNKKDDVRKARTRYAGLNRANSPVYYKGNKDHNLGKWDKIHETSSLPDKYSPKNQDYWKKKLGSDNLGGKSAVDDKYMPKNQDYWKKKKK